MLTCSRYGCDQPTAYNALGDGQECPDHGQVIPIQHEGLIERRAAQALLEIRDAAHHKESPWPRRK